MFKLKYALPGVIFGIVLIVFCSKKEQKVLVSVADQQLTQKEFLLEYQATKEYQENSIFTKDKVRKFIDENIVGELLIANEAFRSSFNKKPEIIEMLKDEQKRLLIKANGPLYKVIIKDHLTVSETELKEFYDQIKDQIRIAQIVVSSKELADSLYIALQNGANFSQIASLFSIDISSKDHGGNVNQLFMEGSVSTRFDQAAFSLQLNEISRPIKTNYGYQIIKVITKHEAKKQSFENMKLTLERRLKSKKINDFTDEYYDQLCKRYEFSVEPANANIIIKAYRKSNANSSRPQISPEYISDEEQIRPVILFSGGQWSIREFVDKYNNATFINHIPLRRVEDVLNFGYREGIKDMMYLEAVSLKLDQDENYIKDVELAKTHLIAREYQREITKDITEPTAEELQTFYEQNSQRYQGQSFDLMRNQLSYELKNIKAEEKINAVIADLKKKYNIEYDDGAIESVVRELNDSKKNK